MKNLSVELGFVCGALSNDESSDDGDLAQHFIAGIGVDEQRARELVALRYDFKKDDR